MIYLLVEQVMNGTVTMEVLNTGFEAESFDKAFESLTHTENWHKAEDILTTDVGVFFTIPGENGLSIWGSMKRVPLRIR
jgi:hypothetical protein